MDQSVTCGMGNEMKATCSVDWMRMGQGQRQSSPKLQGYELQNKQKKKPNL